MFAIIQSTVLSFGRVATVLLLITTTIISDVNCSEFRKSLSSPSSLSTTAATGHRPKGCVYNKQKYFHGDVVRTDQSCLRCTCKKGVLLCALRVCPPVHSLNNNHTNASSRQCRAVRDENRCCPKVVCDQQSLISTTTPQTPLNFAESGAHPNVSLINIDNSILVESNLNSGVSVSHNSSQKTTILQTHPSSRFPDKTENSPFLVSKFASSSLSNVLDSTPQITYSPDEEHLNQLLAGSGNHCYLNGTFYEEGSAIISSTYCEYCYCIRGKRMCIRPRCHLSILGCLPKYSSEFACCPTSYACGNDALATSPIPAVNLRLLDSYATSTTTTTTTPKPARRIPESVNTLYTFERPFSLFSVAARSSECWLDGQSYGIGDPMPAGINCTQCYCALNGSRVCKKIHCSLPGDHNCIPIVPEGHCCPIEYKCDSNTTKTTITTTTPRLFEAKFRSLEDAYQNNQNTSTLYKVVNFLNTVLTELNEEKSPESNENRAKRWDSPELNLPQRRNGAGKSNNFANGWRAMPKNKNRFRSNPNRIFHSTTTSSTTTSSTTETPIENSETELPETTASSVSTSTELTKGFSPTKCIVEGKEYGNGDILPNSSSNPCNYCRCFYGKEICQEQQCPSPPSGGCVAEKVDGKCCPTFVCGKNDSFDSTIPRPPIRRAPQYEVETSSEPSIDARVAQQPSPSPPPRVAFPIDALPRPIEQLLRMGSRIHFPQNGNSMPGIRLPANLPPNLIMNIHKNMVNSKNRQNIRPSGVVPSHILPMKPQFKQPLNKETQIRPLPQSPIQMPNIEPLVEDNVEISTEPTLSISPTTTRTITTTTTKNPWDIFKISGCNIYGKVYKAGEEIEKLSDKCKRCICSSQGVECKKIC